MEIVHNQELVATILADKVAHELHSIQDFLRWTYSVFNRADIYYGQCVGRKPSIGTRRTSIAT